MLTELRVENLLLIERAELRLGPRLNVLTGETGAGKTVLAHALDLLLGGRARSGIVRPGADEAYVEGVFELPPGQMRAELAERFLGGGAEEGAEQDGEIILARRIAADGQRTRAYVNGRAATVADLRDIGARLVSFYGQHEHRKLTLAAAQLEILDGLCGPEQVLRLRACAEAFLEVRRLEEELERLAEFASARERELDLLEFELGEIDSVALQEREHEELLAARERLRRLDALRSTAGAGAEALAPEGSVEAVGATQLMAAAAARIDALAGVDGRLDALAERLRALVVESEDLAAELRRYGEGLGEEEISLEELEGRLTAIEHLVRKHGGSVRAVLDYAATARARREELAGVEVALAHGQERLRNAQGTLREHVLALRQARAATAPELARAVGAQLASLQMGEATFEVLLTEREPGPAGGDGVEFLIAPNPGVPAGPLREIASGGELSRVMLALMSVANASAADATLVFDEVDAGIGGHTARAVGERLRELGEGRQVLCITHLPQIASLGDRHFAIVKDTTAEPTLTTVVQLDEPEVVTELVRMLGAEDGDSTARRHARDLRKAA
ncbi:MAG TPA: DNA repair protein RecN [Solirubrobacteraceae bacterium]